MANEPSATGWDNCDEYVPILHTSVSKDTNGIILINHQWELSDQCGNTITYTRIDTCKGVSFKLNLLLLGALLQSGTIGVMRDDLRKKGLIPSSEPYSSIASFTHTGYGGGETMKSGLEDIQGSNAIVDWVFIEIRNAENEQEVLATQSALVERNGRVVNMNGDSIINVPGLIENDYYVCVRHRNHLGIMTNSTYFLSSQNPPSIKLDIASTGIFGADEHPCKILRNINALWAGDLNSDGRVIYQGPQNDISSLFVKVVLAQENTSYLANYILVKYAAEDTNLDGQVIYQGPNNDRSHILINTILSHPSNSAFYSNYIVSELVL